MNNKMSVNSPLRALGLEESGKNDDKSMMGLVMARAGLGKTAILVQFALDCMLAGNKVLHVSIGEGIDKTRRWYDDILGRLSEGDTVESIPEIMKKRMIMTFKESSFSKALLEERLDDLVQQDIYRPECLIIDGYDFENDADSVEGIRDFMNDRGLKMLWFSAVSHRGDDRKSLDGVPAPCHEVDGLFETILLIKPDEDSIKLDILKCDACKVNPGSTLVLDPQTMLLREV